MKLGSDKEYSITKVRGRVAFCDPAFGGRDKAVFGTATFVEAQVTDLNGIQTSTELLVFDDFFHNS